MMIWWISGMFVLMLNSVVGSLIELVFLLFVLRMLSVRVELVMIRYFLLCCGCR